MLELVLARERERERELAQRLGMGEVLVSELVIVLAIDQEMGQETVPETGQKSMKLTAPGGDGSPSNEAVFAVVVRAVAGYSHSRQGTAANTAAGSEA